MLQQLKIKDFALIREVQINFGPRLNIITGETGAGKSIILGALNLILGSKASTDLIRPGASRATVSGSFQIKSDKKTLPLLQLLKEYGFEGELNLILKREITVSGQGRSFINTQQIPVSLLKKVGRFLVDIHGQNEHQNIMNAGMHRGILDRFAGLERLASEVRSLYFQKNELYTKLMAVSLNESEKNRRLEILKHDIEEIEKAKPVNDTEFNELISQEKSLTNAETIIAELNQIYSVLKASESNILQRLSTIDHIFSRQVELDSSLNDIYVNFQEGLFLLAEVATSIQDYVNQIDLDQEKLSIIRERIDLIQKILKKHGPKVKDILLARENAYNELEGIELSGEEEARLRKELESLRSKIIKKASELSSLRMKSAGELEKMVQKELQELYMADTQIRVSVKWEQSSSGDFKKGDLQYQIQPFGLDIIEFLLGVHPENILRPLRKIASGGEMSRIMLALKKVIIDSDPVFTMIFDEVDAGIGGKVADAVGKKLEKLAIDAQVIVITHLHQIAAINLEETLHWKVEKDQKQGTKIIKLDREQRIMELARMIGGEEVSKSALEHAKSLIVDQ